eukprot:COSAG02_NODE_6370_length_3619_cov_86.835227_4_plen_124_part_00
MTVSVKHTWHFLKLRPGEIAHKDNCVDVVLDAMRLFTFQCECLERNAALLRYNMYPELLQNLGVQSHRHRWRRHVHAAGAFHVPAAMVADTMAPTWCMRDGRRRAAAISGPGRGARRFRSSNI